MKVAERDDGLDGLDRFELHVLCQRAQHAHPTLLPPPTPDLVRHALEVLKDGLDHGERGGRCEGVPC